MIAHCPRALGGVDAGKTICENPTGVPKSNRRNGVGVRAEG